MDFKKIIGNRIKKERTSRGLNRDDLASMAELHVNLIGRIERGVTNTGYENMHRICKALNISLCELYKGY